MDANSLISSFFDLNLQVLFCGLSEDAHVKEQNQPSSIIFELLS
jgi:hypothetical protein